MDTRSGTIIDGRYEFGNTLGKGKFAIVKRAKHLLTGEDVAIKVIDKNKIDEVSRLHIHKEVKCMKLLRHPHVIKLYEAIDTETHLFLIMELGDGGDLYDYIMKHECGLEESRAKCFFAQMVTALSYCHNNYVVHRDLKPENMVLCSESQHDFVKLTDFGFSNVFEEDKTLQTSCGSLAYSAPEILLGEEYDASAVDVWSMGVILYKLVSGEAPFAHANDSETLTMIMDCKYDKIDTVSEECNDLIDQILRREPCDRIKINDIMKHPWLQNIPKETYEPCSAKHRTYSKKNSKLSNDHEKICGYLKSLASIEEITEALLSQKFNFLTAAYFLFAEKLHRARHRQSTRTTPRSTHISPIPSLPPSPRSTSPTPGTSPPRSQRHSSGKMSPGPPFPREHLTITPRKGPVTREGIEHMAEEERSSRSQATTDSEDDFEFNTNQPTPDEILAAADAKLRRERYGEPNSTGSSTGSQGSSCGNQTGSDRNGTETRTSNETSESSNSRKTKSRNSEKHHRDRSNNGRGSRSELKEIHEEPESEDDDFDIEASPRQNRLKMGSSPSSTRRRRNRPGEYRDDCTSPVHDMFPPSTASSDSESSESRRTSSRDLTVYVAQIKHRERRDRDSSDERDPSEPKPDRTGTNHNHHRASRDTNDASSSNSSKQQSQQNNDDSSSMTHDDDSSKKIKESSLIEPTTRRRHRRKKKPDKDTGFESISDKRYFVLCQ